MPADNDGARDAPTPPADAGTDGDAFAALLPHIYRGEIAQANNAQNRMDQTANWAITLLAVLLSVVFASPTIPAYLLLVGIVALSIFLSYEVRRYRYFNHYRARVQMMQQTVIANTLEPDGSTIPWRRQLGHDLRSPTFKVTMREALSHRLHHIYGLLFAILGVAWVIKITAFTPETRWTEAAELPGVPGVVVAAVLGGFYLLLIGLLILTGGRRVFGEIHETDPDQWNTIE